MKKKVLYFVPDDFISTKAGNTTRFNRILSYFNEAPQLEVDCASVRYWEDDWQGGAVQKFDKVYENINLRIIDRKPPKGNVLKYIFGYKLLGLFYFMFLRRSYLDRTNVYLRKQFSKIIEEASYDFIIISYTSWAKLLPVGTEAYRILDTHDFMSLQLTQTCRANRLTAKVLVEEMKTINDFDEVWTYSVEEEYVFGQFSGNKNVKIVPVSFPLNALQSRGNAQYDVIYVASDNPHNIKSFSWYVEFILPRLSGVKTTVIGTICNKVADHPNILKLGVVEDLGTIYQKSKVCVCPMLSGTGIKIKVLEALSYGIPVVTNRRGIDGLFNKVQNGCLVSNDPAQFADYILALLQDEELYQQTSKNGYDYFVQNHSEEKEREFLDATFLKSRCSST